jgi:outer membrane murein-binding lipoprotein Lpp
MTTKSYGADELRAHAARLQDMVDGIKEASAAAKRQPPADWVAGVERTIWALTVSAQVVDQIDTSIREIAARKGFAMLPPVAEQMRSAAVTELMKAGLPDRG